MVRLALVCVVGALLSSCNQLETRVSTLWTNVPEMALCVEKFNTSQRDWQILLEYKDDPAAVLAGPGPKADLVIARGLATSAVKDGLVPLGFLFDGGNLSRTSFYKGILEAGQQGETYKLLPVSFDLPILIFSEKTVPDLPGFSVDLESLKSQNARFSVGLDGKSPTRMAFSPRWQSFGLTLLHLKGADFREGFQRTLTWDSSRLNEGLSMLHTWPSPGWDQVTEFQRKYLQSDPVLVLNLNRIQFFPSTLATFLSRPWQERRGLDFRFVDSRGLVAATDSTVWAGIPSSSLTRGAAEGFLAWLFRVDTQENLIRQTRAGDDRAFGLARGLSALVVPNGKALADGWPDTEGRMPRADQVAFWGELPADWSALKAAVIRPWLETPSASEESLKAAFDKFRSSSSRN